MRKVNMNKIIACILLLVTFILSSCTPGTAEPVPTATTTLTAVPSAILPPTVTATRVTYLPGLSTSVPEPDAAFIRLVVNEHYLSVMGLTREQVVLTYKEHTGIDGLQYAVMVDDVSGVPLAVYTQGEWQEATLKFFGKQNGIIMGSDTRGTPEDIVWQKTLATQFSRATIEPGIDWYASEPVRGQIDPESTKNIKDQIEILKKDGITDLVGHPIIDNGGAPAWIQNGSFTLEELRSIMTDRIVQIISNNKEIDAWVVVNEPYLPASINPGRSKDPFYKVWGNYDYIYEAFQIARNEGKKEGRDLELIYNDGDNHYADGQSSAITRKIVRKLKEQNLVDYVGMQMHIGEWEANAFEKYMLPEMPAEFQYYKGLGVPILITEMTYYPSEEARKLNKHEFNKREALIFTETIKLLLASNDVEGITFWGMTDFYIVKDNPDYTMFDEEGKPKLVFYEVMKTLYQGIKD